MHPEVQVRHDCILRYTMTQIGLRREFFSSDLWGAGGRQFSRQEAFLDLVGVVSTVGVDEDPVSTFSGRWGWAPERTAALLRKTEEIGWISCSPWRVLKGPGVEPPPAGDPTMIRSLHCIYNEMTGRNLKLTNKRRQKYRALLDEYIGKREDPEGSFRRIIRCVMDSGFHMGNTAYHDPASLFRNEERRERWVKEADRGAYGDDAEDAAQEIAHAAGYEPESEDEPEPDDLEDLQSWYTSLPEAKKVEVTDAWKNSLKRFGFGVADDPEYRKAMLYETIRDFRQK